MSPEDLRELRLLAFKGAGEDVKKRKFGEGFRQRTDFCNGEAWVVN